MAPGTDRDVAGFMRGLLLIGFGLLFGLLVGRVVDLFAIRPLLGGAALLLGLFSWVLRERPKWVFWLALASTFCAGLTLPARTVPKAPPAAGLYRLEVSTTRIRHGRSTEVDAEVLSGENVETRHPLERGSRVRLRGVLPAGSRVKVLAVLRPVTGFRNRSPSVPWPMDPLAARGRIVGEPDVIARAFWSERLESVRDGIRHRLEESLTGGASGVARALVLGDGGAVDEMRRDVVRGAGLAHVLAVSGLHVAIAVGLLVFGLGAVLRRIEPLAARVHTDRIANALGVPIALLYAEVAGGAPSARRAALTAALAFLCHALGRRASPIPLAMAAIGILAAATPDRLLDPGLALSVVATLSVVTARAATDGTVRSFLWAAATVSARATLATAPIVWWCFGSVPLVAVMANVVLAPLAATLLIPLSLLHTLVSFVLSPFAVFTASAFEVVEGGFTGACALVSAVSVGRDLPPPTLAQGLVACAGTLAALMLARRRALVALVVTGALLLGLEAHVWHAERGDGVLRVTFLDVGQGDAIAIDMPDGETMVIDGGGGGARPGLRALLPLLEARRRRRVDVVVVSHPHPDHYEGIGDLIDALEVGELWVTGQAAVEEPDGDAAALSARAALSGAHIARPETLCGAPRRFGGAVVRVIAPCPRYDPGYDPNDNSLVLSLRYGERTFLFTGDAEAHEESLLVASGGVRADVLKVGHHGSRTSSGAVFLDAVRPALSVISAGIENRYGHPHPEVYERLARRGRVLSTAKDGGVEVITNGQGLTVRPYHGPSFALDLYSARQPTK